MSGAQDAASALIAPEEHAISASLLRTDTAKPGNQTLNRWPDMCSQDLHALLPGISRALLLTAREAWVYSEVHVACMRGDLARAAALLRGALQKKGFEPRFALTLVGVLLHRDAPIEALPLIDHLYRHAPQLDQYKLRELALAYDVYLRCRTDEDAARARAWVAPPSDWQRERLEAAVLHARGRYASAVEQLYASDPPPVRGRCITKDGEEISFESLTDVDALRGPSLVCLDGGRVFEVPFAQVRRVELVPARNHYGVVIPAADVLLKDGQSARVRVPLRYPGSGRHSDPDVCDAKTTCITRFAGYPIAHGVIQLRTERGVFDLASTRVLELE